MNKKTFIAPPDSAKEYREFFRENAVEDFTAVTFYRFYKFKFSQRRDANLSYKIVRDHAISQCSPKETAAMVADWRFGKGARKDYWDQLYAEEKRKERLAQHVGRLENDVMDRSEIVSEGLTNVVAAHVELSLASLFSAEAIEGQSDINEEENEVEEAEGSDNRNDLEQKEQSTEARAGNEREDTDDNASGLYHDSCSNWSQDLSEEEQPATPDLYSDDVGDVDGPGGLIDQDDHFDDSSEGEELNAVAADVENTENPFVPRKKRKTKARAFDRSSRASFKLRYKALGRKWTLASGTVVEDRLYEIGLECDTYLYIYHHGVRSFFSIA